MYDSIIIRTGIRAFIYREIQRIYLSYKSLKSPLFLKKKLISESKSNLSDDISEDISNASIPSFNTSTAVLYISDYSKPEKQINKNRLILYRCKIQQECLLFLKHGYTDFIVDYGCEYGIVALIELLKLKNNREFNLFYGKARREHASCITPYDTFKLIDQCFNNGAQNLGILPITDFFENVIKKIYSISYEKGITQKTPKTIYEYYNEKIDLNNRDILYK